MTRMHTPPPPSPGRRRPWNPWPASLIAFFALAIAGFAAFIVFCHLHPTDLVAADYYEQELRYQAQLEQLQRTRQLQAPDLVRYDPVAHAITLQIPLPAAAAPPTGDIHLYRPSAAGLDRQLKLDVDGRGRQSIDATSLPPGLWRVKVRWSAGGQDYGVDQKVVIGAAPS